ncbi:MAG: hypothetical protein IJA94_02055 [Bacilli bacterium]|nr:hypothetical protein [Bacilli bacterium]
MAKKKMLKNIQISNQELTPTTIGYLDSKQKGPFLLIIIFAILFATLYYLPTLTEYFRGTKIPNDGNPSGEVYDDEGKIFIINSETVITIKNIEFSKINISNNKLSVLANNTKESVTPLKYYYIELYDKEEKILERIDLSNESLNKYGKRTFTYDIVNQEEIYKISISIISNDELPKLELRAENGIQKLTCSKNRIAYNYEFNENKLKKVTLEVNSLNSDYENESSYLNDYKKYQNMAESGSYTGVSQYFSNVENGFNFTKTIDLAMVDSQNIDDEMFYVLDETASKVAFQNSLKKYKCY